jgi:hypothetical protein
MNCTQKDSSTAPAFTVADVAAHFNVKPDVVLTWISSGELRATNVASSGCRRPRWRIEPEALNLFVAARSAAPKLPVSRRRRQRPVEVITYF